MNEQRDLVVKQHISELNYSDLRAYTLCSFKTIWIPYITKQFEQFFYTLNNSRYLIKLPIVTFLHEQLIVE